VVFADADILDIAARFPCPRSDGGAPQWAATRARSGLKSLNWLKNLSIRVHRRPARSRNTAVEAKNSLPVDEIKPLDHG